MVACLEGNAIIVQNGKIDVEIWYVLIFTKFCLRDSWLEHTWHCLMLILQKPYFYYLL